MQNIVISGTGLFTPSESISNEELVASYNQYVEDYNREHQTDIEAGDIEPHLSSSVEFIEKASGIKSRYVMDKAGILDPDIMCPRLPERSNDEMSILCEMSVAAAEQALEASGKKPEDIDAVLVACSNIERPYPAVAIEVQQALGIDGYAFDMNVACSTATFGIQTGADAIRSGNARAVLMVNPEICSGHLNFRDRDSHFIFGDVCTAVVLESRDQCTRTDVFEIIGTRLKTRFSNNIRNNFGFLNRTCPETRDAADKLFIQKGPKVFKEIVPLASDLIRSHLEAYDIKPSDLKRVWLHQANINLNRMVCQRVLKTDITPEFAPTILDTYANTASAGSIIAFHKYHDDLVEGDLGIICSFGAGYSVGNIIVRRCSLH